MYRLNVSCLLVCLFFSLSSLPCLSQKLNLKNHHNQKSNAKPPPPPSEPQPLSVCVFDYAMLFIYWLLTENANPFTTFPPFILLLLLPCLYSSPMFTLFQCASCSVCACNRLSLLDVAIYFGCCTWMCVRTCVFVWVFGTESSAQLGQGIRTGGGSVVPITGPGGLQQHHHHHSIDRRSSGSLRVSRHKSI